MPHLRPKTKAQPYRQPRSDSAVDAAAARQGTAPHELLPVLQDVQRASGSLSRQALGAAADALRLPDANVCGVATFYSLLATRPQRAPVVRLCDGPVCMLAGCPAVRAALEKAAAAGGFSVVRTSCLGLCDRAPAALVDGEACGPLLADNVAAALSDWGGEQPTYADPRLGETRRLMERLGRVDPDDIQTALAAGAYEVLAAALQETPSRVLEAVAASGLQGRGGAGFPAGRKWPFVAAAAGPQKYVVCNADESEPANFKDRILLEGDPHLLLEGMALAAYAVGASEGYVYVRGEYADSARRVEQAIRQAADQGWLGAKIAGGEFSFRVRVHRGAGAYICGEETALLESLEGRRGEPRVRPPYPVTHGLFGRPTLVSNVETLCNVPLIVRNGAAWFRALGTQNSPGTKMFTITGHVHRPGAVEVPLGTTLRELIDGLAGGMRAGSSFKMALTGGAAGTIVGEAALDVPLDYASHRQGVAMGSGGILVMDESVRVVELLAWLLWFFENESCGKCTPCRVGTREARLIVDRLCAGGPRKDDLEQLKQLARMLKTTSLCGLGQSAAWPIESAFANFSAELRKAADA